MRSDDTRAVHLQITEDVQRNTKSVSQKVNPFDVEHLTWKGHRNKTDFSVNCYAGVDVP